MASPSPVPPPRSTLPPPVSGHAEDGAEGFGLPNLICIEGDEVGRSYAIERELTIGRSSGCGLVVPHPDVSRLHARIFVDDAGTVHLEDAGSANGTRVNRVAVIGVKSLHDGDKIRIGPAVFRYARLDGAEVQYQKILATAIAREAIPTSTRRRSLLDWTPDTWRTKPIAQQLPYEDTATLEAAVKRLRRLPPLVTSWEIEELKTKIAEAQVGQRFILQGGDCAETIEECQSDVITNKLKILLQMSLVLVQGARRPITRIGRFAGQYAKPRSKPSETRDGVELPSYFGDLVNRAPFNAEARRPDANLLLMGYYHAALTLNFVRALSSGGFSDLRRPEYFDLFFDNAQLPNDLRLDYTRLSREIREGLHFMQAVGDRSDQDLMKIDFFTSHEGLNLFYESAQTRRVPRREGFYDLTTHLPWVGERTRALDGAHIDFFRGVSNPLAVKIGPSATPDNVIDLCHSLNPANEPGKLVLITRMGAGKIATKLPPLIEAIQRARRVVLWVSDPMHGNQLVTRSGIKTRDFEDILKEVELAMDVHSSMKTHLGGVHFELTGEDVTECIGGGLGEGDLSENYATLCDPRLNYRQAVQMAFCISRHLTKERPSSAPRP
jgi:3-deoxy-7-phosphoheptulonate synthase